MPLKLVNNKVSDFKLSLFKFEKENYHVLEKGKVDGRTNVIVRIESACPFAHLYGSQLCDCEWQLKKALEIIDDAGAGLLIYALDQHGRGVGLENHVRVYMQEQKLGLDTVEAHLSLGLEVDARDYSDVLSILRHYHLKKIILLTNNPHRIDFLTKNGIQVTRMPLEMPLNKYNEKELRVKKEKMGHLLSLRYEDSSMVDD